jgi:hypothetical protein
MMGERSGLVLAASSVERAHAPDSSSRRGCGVVIRGFGDGGGHDGVGLQVLSIASVLITRSTILVEIILALNQRSSQIHDIEA